MRVVDDKMLVFDPKEDEEDFYYQGKKNNQRDLNKKQKKDQKFAFDAVYGPDSTNDQVYEGTTKDLVETIFNGFNCSVFAYGATGAGEIEHINIRVFKIPLLIHGKMYFCLLPVNFDSQEKRSQCLEEETSWA